MSYLTLILITTAGIILGYWLVRLRSHGSGVANNKGISKINTKKRENKEEGKRKILELLQNKSSIKNDDVENLIGVSDATATRYLDELEAENKIIAQSIGRGTYYILR